MTGQPNRRTRRKAPSPDALTAKAESIIREYTGANVDLDAAFETPPEPIPDHPAIANTGSTLSQNPYKIPNPAESAALAATGSYAREEHMKTLHRLMLRDASAAQIANAMDLPLHQVLAMRNELRRRMGEEALNFNHMSHIGMSIREFDQIRSQAWRQMTQANLTHKERQGYMAIVVGTLDKKHKFLHRVGVYDGAPMQPDMGDTVIDDDATLMHNALKALVQPDVYEDAVYAVLDGDDPNAFVNDPAEQDNLHML